MQKKSTVVLISAIISISLSINAQAQSGNDKLTDMFQKYGFYVNNTQPGAYEAQTQGFISGGSLNIRSKYETVRLGSITPPNIRAGCGGVDMYFGGINFVNKQELVNMMKSIGQNALGYAFQLGLEAVCPTCNSVIKYLRDLAGKLNNLKTDSCTAAKFLVNSVMKTGSTSESTVDKCARELVSNGSAADHDDARQQCLTDNAQLASGIYDEAKQKAQNNEKNPESEPGIATAVALKHLPVEEKALALNILGTYVYKGPGDSGEETEIKYIGPMIGFKDLMYGKPNALVYYPDVLEDPGYIGLINSDIDDVGAAIPYNTISNPVVNSFFDNYLANGFTDYVKSIMTGILTKLNSGSQLTQTEKEFVNASIVPVQRVLEITRHVDGVPDTVIEIYSGIISAYMIEELINGYAKEAIENANQQSQVKPKEFIERMEKIKEDLHRHIVKTVDHYEAVFKSYELTAFFNQQLNERIGDSLSKAISAPGGDK